MDTEAFIRWALDGGRTVEERYCTELLVEKGVGQWEARRQIYRPMTLEWSMARDRERKLNPAYEPQYSRESLEKAVEGLAELRALDFHSDRPLRSIAPLRFLTTLESFKLRSGALTDLEPLCALPALHTVHLGSPGYDFGNPDCEDFTPLTRCAALRELELGFNADWPDFTGFDRLSQIEVLTLSGNLLALPRELSFARVHHATLHCRPLPVRSVKELPQLSACEFLTLSGAQSLEGIEQMPKLRNLNLLGPFRSHAPLEALRELSCLVVDASDHRDPRRQPRDVTPLVRLPKLRFLQIGPKHMSDIPRDYSPLAEAPELRELVVRGCPPVETEVAAINAALPPWDDLFLSPEPRVVPPLQMVVAPQADHPSRGEVHRAAGETGHVDTGLCACEGRWVGEFLQREIASRIGHTDWGEASADGMRRMLHLTVESFEVVNRLPEIIDAARSVIARLREEYVAYLMICLRVRLPEPTPAQAELEEQFQRTQDEWAFEQRQRDEAEYLERMHQLELKKQQGAEVRPEQFSPSEREPYPEPPWETDAEDSGDDDDGDIAVAEKTDPPPSYCDDTHPLYEQYLLAGSFSLSELWLTARHRALAVQLMGREPDRVIAEPEKQ